MKKRLSISVITVLSLFTTLMAQDNSKPLEIMKPFLGNWAAPDTAKIYKIDPARKGTNFFGFKMMGKGEQIMMLEDFGGGKSDTVFVALITPNPLTGQLELFGSNMRDGFLFKGFIVDITPTSFTRHYDVFYPKDHPIAKQAGQMVSYKEKFVLKDKNTMEFDVQFYSKKGQVWRNWSPGKYIVVRKS